MTIFHGFHLDIHCKTATEYNCSKIAIKTSSFPNCSYIYYYYIYIVHGHAYFK